MKATIYHLCFMICCILIQSQPTFGQSGTISFNQYCAAGYTNTWAININEAKHVRIKYAIDISYQQDYIGVFQALGGSPDAVLTGFSSGTTICTSSNGIAYIVFLANTSGNKRIEIEYEADNPIVTSSSLSVGGTATIGGGLTLYSSLSSPYSVNSYFYGKLGVGTTLPSTKLHVANTSSLGSAAGSNVPLTRLEGRTSNKFLINDFVFRESSGTNWNTASYIRGVGIDDSFLTPSTLRSWIKQNPYEEKIEFGSSGVTYLTIGNAVGPDALYRLLVNGHIHTTGIVIEASETADFVFDKDYELMGISELDAFIKAKGHLPEMPNNEDVRNNGINVKDMQNKLLQKIEELTLYVIQLKKEIDVLKSEKSNP